MAHKNVSFVLIPKIMMTTGEKIWRKTISRIQFWNIWELLQNFLMRGSRQTLPTLIEECSNTKLLCELAATTFDQGQAYSNSKVHWRIMSLNNCRVYPRLWGPPPKRDKTSLCFILFVKKGSHQCRGAFFTDSNELDPAVMTERSDPKRKWQMFFIFIFILWFLQDGRPFLRYPVPQCNAGSAWLLWPPGKDARTFPFSGEAISLDGV